MKRRFLLAVAAVGVMIGLGVLAQPKKPPRLLLLEWAHKSKAKRPPAAVLIEMGLKDKVPTPHRGRAVVKGAKVVRREGYRFRPTEKGKRDRLVEPDGWSVWSHRGLRAPPRNPVVNRLEGIATVGVVLHLADVAPDATLTVEPDAKDGREKAVVRLKDVLAGKAQTVWGGAGVVRLVSTAVGLSEGKTEDDFPAAAYGPDGVLWVAYIAYHLKDESRRVEQRPLKGQPKDFKAFYTPAFGDQLFVRYRREGKWSAPIPLTGPREDLVRCAVAVDGDGTAWVVYSANRKGRHDLHARPVSAKSSPEGKADPAPRTGLERCLTTEKDGGGFLNPVACTDQAGNVRIACQAWGGGHSAPGYQLRLFQLAGGKAVPGGELSGEVERQNVWASSASASAEGRVVYGFDVYRDGDYDVGLAVNGTDVVVPAASTAKFEARPSACFDAKGRLWVAYEEGPERWGQDYGALDESGGNPLYNERSVRVVCLEGGKLFRPAAELPTSKNPPPRPPFGPPEARRAERAPRYSNPRLGLDGKGRLWLTYRQKFGTRYTTHPGSYWLTFARRLDGDKWTDPIEVHHSDGLLDHRPALLPHPAGGLLIVHNTDGRYTTPEEVQNRVYVSYVDLPGEPVEPKLVPHVPGKKDARAGKELARRVKRIRDYRVEAGGKKYRLLRGDFHRHTEVSWDGGPDGSLEDMFRYAVDAAALDWVGNTDHDNGAGREYSWWLTQKLTDAYTVPGQFAGMFSYERSVAYPHGHRNCLFDKRGVRTLPRLAATGKDDRVAGVHKDDTKMLYRYLKELGGICASHTSATTMGTDWRDNDPEVEPVVEIYQGDRMSYEHEGAPRAGYDPRSGKKPANIAGWKPDGFVDRALAKGYRLGFQSSSDHWSTHISFCVVLAERNDRASILKALRQRHCYGATDDIVLDVRSGPHLMGDEFKTASAPALGVRVIGTEEIAGVDVLKDSKVVHTIKAKGREYRGTWTDPSPTPGTHAYYVRVRQKKELAWSSPMWVEYTGR
jgi:hypothetical protein